MEIKELNVDNFNEFISQKGKIAIVDFYASWCGPCKMLAPILHEIAEEADEKYVFGKINVDDSFSLAKSYTVMSVPTLIKFEDGVETDRMVGLKNREAIEKEFLSK